MPRYNIRAFSSIPLANKICYFLQNILFYFNQFCPVYGPLSIVDEISLVFYAWSKLFLKRKNIISKSWDIIFRNFLLITCYFFQKLMPTGLKFSNFHVNIVIKFSKIKTLTATMSTSTQGKPCVLIATNSCQLSSTWKLILHKCIHSQCKNIYGKIKR